MGKVQTVLEMPEDAYLAPRQCRALQAEGNELAWNWLNIYERQD